jgi:nitrogen regulatory protein PII
VDRVVKLIEAIIQPFGLDGVKEALARAGAQGATLTEVREFGGPGDHTELYRGVSYVEAQPSIKIEIVVHADLVERVTSALVRSTGAGRGGGGNIVVVPLDGAVRIRTGQIGEAAIY